MSTLLQRQTWLLDALFAWPAKDAVERLAACAQDPNGRGVLAYQSNGHLLAQRALQAAYPVIRLMLGDETFADVARALWHAHPPQRGDLGLWGDSLPGFLADSPQLQELPYLADVARVEWALHRCACAADTAPALDTLALLTTADPDVLRLTLAPGCVVLASAYPVVTLVHVHLANASPDKEGLVQAAQALHDGVAQTAVVWRVDWKPQVRVALPAEAEFLEVLLRGQSLGQALNAAPDLDVGQWLPQAVQEGLLMAVEPL